MGGVVRSRIDRDVASSRLAHQVAVGAWAGHRAGVGRGQPLHMLHQLHRLLRLPVQVMPDLAVRTGQRQLAIGHLAFHVAHLLASQEAGPGAGRPQRALFAVHGGAGLQNGLDAVKGNQPLQGANGREDDEEIALPVARQGIRRADPDGLKLFLFVRHRRLPFRNPGHQKRHVKAPRQVTVGDPVRQHKHLVSGQRQPMRLALPEKRRVAVERGNVAVVGQFAASVAGHQDPQFLVALADGGDGLGQAQIGLRGSARGVAVRLVVRSINAATRKHIGAGCKTGRHRSAGHQHFRPGR